MKSPLGKMRKLGLNKGEPDEDWDHHISLHVDGLTEAAKDMKDMRTCYDGLLSAATANSVYALEKVLRSRHHAAQLNFFRKGLQSLEAVEPHIRNVAENQHIDYELSELNDRESSENNEDGELSCDYSQNKKEVDNTTTSRNSMELDQLGAPSSQTSGIKNAEVQINNQDLILSEQHRARSHSAPLYAEKLDSVEGIREIGTSVQKFSSHVLPTPDDAKSSIASSTPFSISAGPGGSSRNPWHSSSPLDIEEQKKLVDDHISASSSSKSQVSAADNSNKKHFLPLPPIVAQLDAMSGSDSQKIKRQAFSGPLVSKLSSNKQPIVPKSGLVSSTEVSGIHSRVSGPRVSGPISPKISEPHELPRPPGSSGSKIMHPGRDLGHSAPLVNSNRELSPTNRNPFVSTKEGSRLPLPQLTVSRSFSIPCSSQRAILLNSSKPLESSQIVQKTKGSSPSVNTYTPIKHEVTELNR